MKISLNINHPIILEVRGNIVTDNAVAFLFAPKSQTTFTFNALPANERNYLKEWAQPVVFPERAGQSDLTSSAPHFVNSNEGDFRLKADTPLLKIEEFSGRPASHFFYSISF